MGIADTISALIGGKLLQEGVNDNIDVESMVDDRTLTLKDGSLLTMVQMSGALRQPGSDEMIKAVHDIRRAMASYLAKPGHMIEVNFLRDASAARRYIERLTNSAKRNATALGMEMDDVFNERIETLSQKMVAENCLISIYTRPSILESEEAKSATKAAAERIMSMPSMVASQNWGKTLDEVHQVHISLVDALVTCLTQANQLVVCLSTAEALQEMRAGLYPDTYPFKDEWTARFPGWSVFAARGERSKLFQMPETPAEMLGNDYSNLGVPTFDRQLATEDSKVESNRLVTIGNTTFQAFDMTLAPEVLPDFNVLIEDITQKATDVPWRASLRIEGGGVQSQRLKMMFLGIFAFANPQHNVRIRNALALNAMSDGDNETIAKMRMSFMTWAPARRMDTLRRNAQILAGAVKRWGNTGIDGITGDPLATALSCMPGLTTRSTAPPAAGPLSDIIGFVPLARQASPWDHGALLLRTPSGKPWAFQPGSIEQTTWITLLCGTPGSGKSVMLNAMNFASAISPNAASGSQPLLPRIVISDIGSSSSGFIDLIRSSLPPERWNEVVFQKLRMDPRHAVNILDTPAGMRRPLSAYRDFQSNFISLLCAEPGKEPSGPLLGLITTALSEVYEEKSDNRNPNIYVPNEVPEIDRLLAELNFIPLHTTNWWEVTDFLYMNGYYAESEIAQRQAVPVLSDLAQIVSVSPQVRTLYGKIIEPETQESLIDSFVRILSEVAKSYPIINNRTRYSIGSARIIAMDLMDVTSKGNDAASLKQTALMYMLSRYAMTKDFFLDPKEFIDAAAENYLPQAYVERHVEIAETNLQVPKIICMDEFHRTGRMPSIVNQLLQDAREGRKFNVDIRIASQLIEDFPKSMLEVASTLVVCNAGSENSIHYIDQTYMLSSYEQSIIRNKLRGPTPKGAPVWMMFKTKDYGQVRQELVLTLGPVELWAYSTTAQDVALRSKLYDKLGPSRARQVLAQRYPGGSAGKDITARLKAMELRGETKIDDARDNVIDVIAGELIDQAYRQLHS